MSFNKYRILIYSENPDKLVKFYTDILGLKLLNKLTYENDYGYMLNVVDEYNIWIGKHSEVKGKAKENFRHLFNLYPEEGVEYWYLKLKKQGIIKIIAKPFEAPFSTPEKPVWFCTFLDPEGNCWQFVGKK